MFFLEIQEGLDKQKGEQNHGNEKNGFGMIKVMLSYCKMEFVVIELGLICNATAFSLLHL